MATETICVKWNGKIEYYNDNSWTSPRARAFLRFLRQHKKEDNEILQHLYILVYNWIDKKYEKPLFFHDGLTRTSSERMQLTIEGAEQKLQNFLLQYRNDLTKPFSINSIFRAYMREYDYDDLHDIVCSEIADIMGWRIYGNPWNSSLIDEQFMSVTMHRETNGSLKYNWYMEFRNPDLLVTTIDLDAIFDKARVEIESEER